MSGNNQSTKRRRIQSTTYLSETSRKANFNKLHRLAATQSSVRFAKQLKEYKNLTSLEKAILNKFNNKVANAVQAAKAANSLKPSSKKRKSTSGPVQVNVPRNQFENIEFNVNQKINNSDLLNRYLKTSYENYPTIVNQKPNKVTINLDNEQTGEFLYLIAADIRHDYKSTVSHGKNTAYEILLGEFPQSKEFLNKYKDYIPNKTIIQSPEDKIIEEYMVGNEKIRPLDTYINYLSIDQLRSQDKLQISANKRFPYMLDQTQALIHYTSPRIFKEVVTLSTLADAGSSYRPSTKSGKITSVEYLLKPIEFQIGDVFNGILKFNINKRSIGVYLKDSPFFGGRTIYVPISGKSGGVSNRLGKFFGDLSQILTSFAYNIMFASGDKMAIAIYLFLGKHGNKPRNLMAERGAKKGQYPEKIYFYSDSIKINNEYKQVYEYISGARLNQRRTRTMSSKNIAFIKAVSVATGIEPNNLTINKVCDYARGVNSLKMNNSSKRPSNTIQSQSSSKKRRTTN